MRSHWISFQAALKELLPRVGVSLQQPRLLLSDERYFQNLEQIFCELFCSITVCNLSGKPYLSTRDRFISTWLDTHLVRLLLKDPTIEYPLKRLSGGSFELIYIATRCPTGHNRGRVYLRHNLQEIYFSTFPLGSFTNRYGYAASILRPENLRDISPLSHVSKSSKVLNFTSRQPSGR